MMFVKGFVEAKNRPKILYFTKEQINVGEFYANEYDLIGYKFNGYYCIRTTQEFYEQIDDMVEDINWRWLQGVIEAKGKISKNNGNVKVDIRIKNRKIFNRINTILENINIKKRTLRDYKGSKYISFHGNNVTYKLLDYCYVEGFIETDFYKRWLGYYESA